MRTSRSTILQKTETTRRLVLVFVNLPLILCLLSTRTNYWYEYHKNEFNSGLFVKCSPLPSENSTRICSHVLYNHSVGLALSELIFPFLKERVIGSIKTLKVCLFVCPSQSDASSRVKRT